MSRNHDASAEDVYAILEAVRLPQVSLKRMVRLKALPAVIASDECQGLLAEAAAWVEGSGGGRLRASARVRAKKAGSYKTSSLGLGSGSRSAPRAEPRLWGPRGHRSLVAVGMEERWTQRYDVSTNAWSNLSPPVGVIDWAAATSLGGLVYLAGGYVGYDPSARVMCFDPAAANGAGTWAAVAPMGNARAYAAAAALNGFLYVSGGSGDVRSVERYDPASNTWEAVASMTSGRWRHQLVALGGFLYAVGGLCEGKILVTAERYDPESNSWTPIASMARARSSCAAAAMRGFLYVTGGREGGYSMLRSCERYDPAANRWSHIADLPGQRYCHALACLGGSLYAVGGGDCLSEHPRSDSPPWRYNVSTNTWVVEPLAAGSVSLKRYIYDTHWAAV
jgi:N-acetylneuraminic acid mutarotase